MTKFWDFHHQNPAKARRNRPEEHAAGSDLGRNTYGPIGPLTEKSLGRVQDHRGQGHTIPRPTGKNVWANRPAIWKNNGPISALWANWPMARPKIRPCGSILTMSPRAVKGVAGGPKKFMHIIRGVFSCGRHVAKTWRRCRHGPPTVSRVAKKNKHELIR